jgi:hypothetical protein
MSLRLDYRQTALVLIDRESGIVSLPVQPHPANDVLTASRLIAKVLVTVGIAGVRQQ